MGRSVVTEVVTVTTESYSIKQPFENPEIRSINRSKVARMVSPLRSISILSIVLLLIGGTGFAWGSYEQATTPCESGYLLGVEYVEADESPDSSYERVSFDNLSAVEQRILLEALTGERNMSRSYEDSEFGNVSHAVVTYRGEQYLTQTVVNDCMRQRATFSRIGGILLALIGVGGLALVTAWRRFTAP